MMVSKAARERTRQWIVTMFFGICWSSNLLKKIDPAFVIMLIMVFQDLCRPNDFEFSWLKRPISTKSKIGSLNQWSHPSLPPLKPCRGFALAHARLIFPICSHSVAIKRVNTELFKFVDALALSPRPSRGRESFKIAPKQQLTANNLNRIFHAV